MKLVIAEKPSVAKEIAAALNVTGKKQGYFESNDYIITWAVGHLVELAPADAYSESLKKWTLDTLPILPEPWKYNISEHTKTQYKVIAELAKRKEVDELVCATDAGREGELIFRLIYNQMNCKKPFKRLWISSMESQAIKEGFNNLKNSADYDSMYLSALVRSQADWLVGINFTRLFSCLHNKTLNIGRVQSPVLKLIVDRDKEIKDFISTDYFIVTANLGDFKATAKALTQDAANNIILRCKNKDAVITSVKTEEKAIATPQLFSLSSLQRAANDKFGFTAQQTLDLAQSLYEKKLLSYPRTDSSYITSDIQATLGNKLAEVLASNKEYENILVKSQLNFEQLPHIADDSKVSDHYAIIPILSNLNMTNKITETEKQILDMVFTRLIEALSDKHLYNQVTILLDLEGEAFKTTSKQIIQMGWKSISDTTSEADEEQTEVLRRPYSEGEKLYCCDIDYVKKKTAPQKYYTDSTLLSAMENISSKVEDKDLKTAISKGLGTPATRAGVIEKLIKIKFICREKKFLKPTEDGINLISILPENITDAKFTAEWEYFLDEILQGRNDPKTFISDIHDYVNKTVSSYKLLPMERSDVFHTRISLGICPICGQQIFEGKKNYYCENKDCNFCLWKEDNFFKFKGKELNESIVKDFLTKGYTELKGCKTSKSDKKYDATVSISMVDNKVQYSLAFD